MNEQVFQPKSLVVARKPRYSQGMLAAELQNRTRNWTRPLSTTQSMVSEWENGNNVPQERTVRVIAEITGRPIEFFYTSGAEEEDDEEAALLGTPQDLYNALQAIVERTVRERENREIAA
ncbi:MAG: helix-turn-helix domain-containing protein [Bacteroidales bacterium]|nr:helix-turn-helix domain-containing protein [Bacteroidales bacterium]